jgi:ribosome-associated translation inhibitor RaiA
MRLPVQVTFRNIPNPGGLEDYIQKKAAKLERYYQRIISCRVMVERPQRAVSSKLFHVRIDLGVPQGELVVKRTPSLHSTLQDVQEEKSRSEARAVLDAKDPKRAINEAFEEMGRRLQDYVRRQRREIKPKETLAPAKVREIFPQEEYGFLETADGRELYFNAASVLDGKFSRLRIGTPVDFAEEPGDKGPQASTVRVIHPRKEGRTAARSAVLPTKIRVK